MRRIAIAAGASLGAGACALGLALLACGASSGGGAHAAGDGAIADGGAAEAEAGPPGGGAITFTQSPDGGGSFFAGFSETRAPQPTGCTFVDAGACTTASCPAPEAGAPPPADAGTGDASHLDAGHVDASADAATAEPTTAGSLLVTGGVFGAGTNLAPGRAGTYLYLTPGHLFSPGDTLGVSAGGDAIPAFPKQTIVAPPLLDLTAPASSSGTITVTTSQALSVAWTGGKQGDSVVFVATSLFTSGAVASMTCTWDASLGKASIPSAALRPLAASNAIGSGLSWYEQAHASFVAGPAAVTLSASYTPQGSPAAFQ